MTRLSNLSIKKRAFHVCSWVFGKHHIAGYESAVDGTEYIDSDVQRPEETNFTIRSWAKFLLQHLPITLPMLSRILS